ncbi:MAG: hypothetical protein K8953_03260, partial [Proteobacteria bacterium]|nr:hypothetical protein [Pseudomonadota bacterium]
MSIITACGEGDTGIIPIDSSDNSKIQLETETEVTSNKDDTDDSSGSGSDSDSGVSNTTSGDSGSETGSSGQGFTSNSDATLEASRSPIYGGGGVKSPPTAPPTVPPTVPPIVSQTEPENPACLLAICDNNVGVEDLPNYHPSPSIAGKSTFLTIETGKDIDTTGLVNEQLVAI